MKKKLILSSLVAVAIVFAAIAQPQFNLGVDVGQTLNSIFYRQIVPAGAQANAIDNLWNAVDKAKTNTTLRKITITKPNGAYLLQVEELVNVKVVEN